MYQRQVSFKEAVVRALTQNYCNFSGRASRSEYWWFYLFTCIVSWVVSIVVSLFSSDLSTMYIASMVVGLAFLLPSLGIAVRRLHDIGKSGWWMFISLIPLIGAIILLVWWCKDSQMEPIEYGPVPNLVG